MWSTVHRLMLGVLLATLLAAPLAFGAVEPWAWAALTLVALSLTVLWAVTAVRQGVARVVWTPLYVPVIAFLLLGALQFFGRSTLDPIATREALMKLVTGLVVFFLAAQLFGGNNRAFRLGLVATVYALVLAVFAILQFFSNPNLIYWTVKPRWGGWVFGPYVNHNHYAGLMEMLIPLAAAYVISRPRRHPGRLLLAFAVCVALASVLLSGSRGGLIALSVEAMILGTILLRRSSGPARPRLAAAGGLAIIVAVLLFVWMDPGDILKRLSTVANLAHAPEATFGERRLVALDSLRMFRQRPLTGVGLGSFETAYPAFRSFPSDFEWDHAHNDYAEALVETGLVGGALMLVGLVLFLSSAFRHLDGRLQHEWGWMQLGAALGCCGLLVHSLVDFNLHIPANAVWFAFCAGLAVTPRSGDRSLRAIEMRGAAPGGRTSDLKVCATTQA